MAEDIKDVDTRVSIHEAVCAERYNGINARLSRIEGIMLVAVGTMIVALATIAWQVAT